ncbi:hypothetical protein IT570_06020 [Candidatus Sumerlaeota bacterium]|nr:hypothetical protein [Candidatus Sumerlaeota bacterium]
MISRFLVPQMFLGLFLRKLEIQDFRKLAEQLPWRLPELDGQPQVAAEVPKNAPQDATRARFPSADGRKILEVAPAKLQFRMLPGELTEQTQGGARGLKPGTLSESFESFIPQAMKIHSVFNEHFGATAVRIGLLTELFVPVGASSNQRMQKALLSNANHFGDRLQELQIQALAKPVLDGERAVNRWIRVKPLRSNDERQADLAMGVEVDINTLPEDNYDLTTADIEKFLRSVKKHIEEKIPLFQDNTLIED